MHINTYSNKTTIQRFWEKVKKTDGCWLWMGTRSGGYGYISCAGKMISTHRYSYMMHFGNIKKGLEVCHACDVRNCVNPSHLFIGTHEDNMKDARSKGQFARENNGRAKHTWKDIKLIKKMYNINK